MLSTRTRAQSWRPHAPHLASRPLALALPSRPLPPSRLLKRLGRRSVGASDSTVRLLAPATGSVARLDWEVLQGHRGGVED